MSRKIFINYRIDDTRPTATHLAADLARVFGGDAVFLDHLDMEPAGQWPKQLRDEVAAADIIAGQRGPQKLRVAAPSAISACMATDPAMVTPSTRSSFS